MDKDPNLLSRRQILAIVFFGVLSPMIRQIPSQPVKIAGAAAWLTSLVALVPVGLLCLTVNALMKNRLEGEGMGHMFIRALGKVAGRAVLAGFALWQVFYTGFLLFSSANRFISTVYPNSSPYIFIILMLVLCLFATLGRLKVLGRTSEVFLPLLVITFTLVFIFALPDVNIKYLLPVSHLDTVNILKGSAPVANVLSLIAILNFLEGYVKDTGPVTKGSMKILLLLVVISTLLCVTAVGIFGSVAVAEMKFPFFIMIRGVSILNVIEHIEAAVIALWVISDFVSTSVTLFIATYNLRLVFGYNVSPKEPRNSLKNGRWLIWLSGIAAGVTAMMLIAPTSFQLMHLSNTIVPTVNLFMIYAGLPIILLIGKLRKTI